MRVVRLYVEGDVRYGLADDSTVTLISDEPFAAWEPDGTLPLAEAHLLAPAMPTKIVCVGVNYRSHAEEMGQAIPEEPIIFLKPPTSLALPGGEVLVPDRVDSVDHEAELAVVIGRRTHMVGPADAPSHILGYTCANDITARELQRADGQWARAKGFDTFCPMGPWIETDVDPVDLAIECRVNGEVRQSARTSDMIWDPFRLVSFVSGVMTLLPGDVIMTGTPAGVGPMRKGDVCEVRIEDVGSLVSHVV